MIERPGSGHHIDPVVSTDRHAVKPRFQGKIPFTFDLPEFSGTEFTLVGGRMVDFHQQPGAQLIVSIRQHMAIGRARVCSYQ